MIEVIKRRFALSTKGAKDFCKGVFFTTLLDIVLMLPAVFVFLFLEEYLRPVFQPSASVTHGILYYSILGIVFMIVMYIFAVLQYRSTYTTVLLRTNSDIPACILVSFSTSSEAVASSNRTIGASFNKARAMEIR